MWDVFISHAWEDKEGIARPLADELRKSGLNVWYDEFSLTLGDSLRRSIDNGLLNSQFGIVILSPAFFSKKWPQKELDGLVARETIHQKIILPIWHQVDYEDVLHYSPTLADKLAVSTTRGLSNVVNEILQVVGRDKKTNTSDDINSIYISRPKKRDTDVEKTPLTDKGKTVSKENDKDTRSASSIQNTNSWSLISTIAAVVLFGCPGSLLFIFGTLTTIGGGTYNDRPMPPSIGFILICLSLIFMVIPIAVGFFLLRRKPAAVSSNEPTPLVS